MRVRIQLDEHWALSIAFECPSCGKWQSTSVQTAYTGEEFVCECGEDVRITADALQSLRQELDEMKALTRKYLEIPV